jgi:hypothetical protein
MALVTQWKDCKIVFIQEPNQSASSEMKRNGKYYKTRLARSAILVKTKNLDCTLIPQFSNKVITTIQVEKQHIMLCSAYLYCKLDAWPALLDDFALYCVHNKLKLVIGADMNTNSAMWNETRSHSNRTAKVEQGIIRNNLFVFNTGTVPTFQSHIGKSIIDVTMSNNPACVTNWTGSKEISHSDHRVIKFSTNDVKKTEAILRQNVRKVNWAAVSSNLRGAVPRDTPATWRRALSAIISWNLVFDNFLKMYDNSAIKSIGFADDGTLLITGVCINTIYNIMQKALHHAENWAAENGLKFCHKKTNAILFTRKHIKIDSLPHLKMYRQQVPNVKETKMLGVVIDSKLNWTLHITQKIAAC